MDKMKPITRRRFLGGVAGSAALAALPRAVWAQSSPAAARKPNVLFIMSDDMRVELGCYASMFKARTPNLDALAGAGVRFDRNYCQFPLCNPSRSSMLTGRPATKTGVLGNSTAFRDLHPDWVSLPQLFRQNGYVSARNGKIYHNGIDDPKAWTEATTIDEGDGGGTSLHGVAVRTEKWRYAEFGAEGKNGAMLFDPKADPLEMKNLAADPQNAPVVAELSRLTRQYAARLGQV
jgi:arylsulfatase A-like enzyme